LSSRLVIVLAVAIAAATVGVAATYVARAPAGRVALSTLVPRTVSYLGVYEPTAPASYRQVTGFGAAVGREPNLAGYFSGWSEPFQTAFATAARRHGAATLVQVDPTYASVAGIAAGGYDDYLGSFADSVRNFGRPVIIGFGHEMNAPWYSWGYGHVPPATFIAAWRHLVRVFRGRGADNVTWLWTIQAEGPTIGPVAAWWPGSEYVTWVGIDGYYYRPSDAFPAVFGGTIARVRALTSKPIVLSETAVGPAAGQPPKIMDLLRGMAAYQLLGLVWFDIGQHAGIYHQDWRIEDDQAAEQSLRSGLRHYLRP
jgi:mannan endo-1,4-beta-mannosidase